MHAQKQTHRAMEAKQCVIDLEATLSSVVTKTSTFNGSMYWSEVGEVLI